MALGICTIVTANIGQSALCVVGWFIMRLLKTNIARLYERRAAMHSEGSRHLPAAAYTVKGVQLLGVVT